MERENTVCRHDERHWQVSPYDGDVWCFACKPPRNLSEDYRQMMEITDTHLLIWAADELSQHLEENRTCATCGKVADVGYHTTCDHCGKPVCGVCAVQVADGHFCPTCPRELPF